MPVKTPDEGYKKYATPDQWEAYVAVCELGGQRPAVKQLNISRSALKDRLAGMYRKAAQQGYAPPTMTHHVPDGLRLKGTSQLLNGDGELEAEWVKTAIAGREDNEAVHVPDPKIVTKVSTFYDQQGKVGGQWVSERPEEKARALLWESFAASLAQKIEPAKSIARSKLKYEDLLAAYPVGDHHTGMLSWILETGASYDLKISEQLLRDASQKLMATCPPCKQAVIPFLGDFFHYDSYDSVTPTNKNLLDADGRYPKMMDVGVSMILHMIAAALTKHESVRVIFEKGNHDPSTAGAVTVFLKHLYKKEPRVSIDTSPAYYHYYEFGKNLIGTHHGDKSKMKELPAIMAHDQAEAWGRTAHRVWFTGHIHHDSLMEFPGCFVESFGVLAAADAYSANAGYRSKRSMKAIIFDREYGEVERHTVRPEMFKA